MNNTYYIDGFTKQSNPCTEGGYTITDETGKIVERNILKASEGDTITNNYCEFMGLCRAIEIAEPHSLILTDSQNNLSWITLCFPKKSKRKDLIPIAREYNELYIAKSLELQWIQREDNLAGVLNEALK